MSSNVLEERSVVLRLEFSVSDAVRQRGLFPVMAEALRAWWAQTPRHYSEVPDHLRADVGLPLADEPLIWFSVPVNTAIPSLSARRRH